MENNLSRCLHWFRNDLRLDDNLALVKSLEYDQVILVYILDEHFWKKDKSSLDFFFSSDFGAVF